MPPRRKKRIRWDEKGQNICYKSIAKSFKKILNTTNNEVFYSTCLQILQVNSTFDAEQKIFSILNSRVKK